MAESKQKEQAGQLQQPKAPACTALDTAAQELVQPAEAGAAGVVDKATEKGEQPGEAAKQGGGKRVKDERYLRQRKRAAIAVAIMALFSAVLIGAVQFMYYLEAHPLGRASGNLVSNVAGTAEETVDMVNGEETIEPFYVLLIGNDSRRGTALYTGKAEGHAQLDQHADIITLMRVDPQNYLVTLLSIPRDTQLDGESGKINDSLAGNDPEDVVDAVQQLTGRHIDYYAMVNFAGFEDLVDSLGGVSLSVPVKLTLTDPLNSQRVVLNKTSKATRLDGSQALVLARAREEYKTNQDAYRQLNVRRLEVAIMKHALDYYDSSQVGSAMRLLRNNTTNNLDYALTASVMKDFIDHKDLVTFYSATGPYEGRENADGLWVVPQDSETWAALMETVDAGGDPAKVLSQPSLKDLQ